MCTGHNRCTPTQANCNIITIKCQEKGNNMIDDEITKISFEYAKRFQEINSKYLEMMGKQIKDIGKLSPSNIDKLKQMRIYGGNIAKINEELAQASALTVKELSELYEKMAREDYEYASYLYAYANVVQIPFEKNKRLQDMLKAMDKLTAGTFINMSNTTVIDTDYIAMVDKAVQAISTGTTDYYKEIRKAVKQAGRGARVKYASGLTRRLDSAVRMNILEGVRQINQQTRAIMGEEFGNDGWELSAHGTCAPDHVKIQGRQFTLKAYEKMNSGLKRRIGTDNCRHIAFPIMMGISEPNHTKKELQDIADKSAKKVTINGKEYSNYQATQLMRQKETQMRYAKDDIILKRAGGFDKEVKESEKHLNKLRAEYRNIGKIAGLELQYERAYVPKYRV